MEYQPAAPLHTDIFENYIDTQQCQGHLTEGGPLPAFLLTQKFEETPETFDPHSYYDYSRRTLADFRSDPPLWESETPWDTTKFSKTRMNVLHRGSRSGADPPNHAEVFTGFLDEDTRTPGDDHFPAWKLAQQMGARAHYLKPCEPEGATHLTEAINGDGVEPETERYRKLNEARGRVRRNLHMFGRTIENDRPVGGREWLPLPCPGADQRTEGGAGSGAPQPDTQMRSQIRTEYTPDDEKHSVQRRARRGPNQMEAALRAAHACVGGSMADLAEMESTVAPDAPARHDAVSARAGRTARLLRHKGAGPSEKTQDNAPLGAQRGGPDLTYLAFNMADAARHTIGDAEKGDDSTVFTPRKWHIDSGDPLLLLHRATGHEAQRGQEILEIASAIASRATKGPGSLPHLVIGPRGEMGHGGAWAGGPERAMMDDMVPSYLMVDALLMKGACDRSRPPQEMDLIRRRMITDARAPTNAEIELATKTSGLLLRAKSASVAASKTYQDMEMASDALELYNQHQMSLGSAPASWHHATSALTEAQLTAEPERCRAMGKTAPREAPVASSALRTVASATRADIMGRDSDHVASPVSAVASGPYQHKMLDSTLLDPTAYTVRDRETGMTLFMGPPAVDPRRSFARVSTGLDRIEPMGDHVRGVGSARLGTVMPSRQSLLLREENDLRS